MVFRIGQKEYPRVTPQKIPDSISNYFVVQLFPTKILTFVVQMVNTKELTRLVETKDSTDEPEHCCLPSGEFHPVYPTVQKHANEPRALTQTEFSLHVWLPILHSSISTGQTFRLLVQMLYQ